MSSVAIGTFLEGTKFSLEVFLSPDKQCPGFPHVGGWWQAMMVNCLGSPSRYTEEVVTAAGWWQPSSSICQAVSVTD